ncbi:Endonuclease/Exonuclease/phosphatase family protein [Pseudoalteromonas denitrificans DSM 6059]|uniref:Endonuclease/Exonuclease/phosphatase family protein n=2 Tax=Pseudoalteromonas TaxID=53246 RepID=A0A1I1PKV1_9GAMM|nr:Endonuclease/Exonuclease/phosphatase family protein [Pseudoalteromonas denitrificans DSM 6059]
MANSGSTNKHFKIATLNLLNYASPPFSYYQLDENYSAIQWQNKNIWLTRLIANISPDIIAFQEVFSIDALAKHIKPLGYDYLTTVDMPCIAKQSEFILMTPVVALASKYPIIQADALKPDKKLLKHLNLPENFTFSRRPIKAEIQLPQLGIVRIYVLHLKSKRATKLNDFANNTVPKNAAYNEKLTQTVGSFYSQELRCLEGMLIYHDALFEQATNPQPSIILGDFNDDIHASALSLIFENTLDSNEVNHLDFFDAFDISNNNTNTKPPTLYYEGKGKVLDYILLSNEFNQNRENTKLTHLTYHTIDKHILTQPDDKHKTNSDHACIYIQFEVKAGS